MKISLRCVGQLLYFISSDDNGMTNAECHPCWKASLLVGYGGTSTLLISFMMWIIVQSVKICI